ncbi:MAG: hypothetical protein EON54_06890 [Alcaligenaceae bacterium]|nr:MAG: hypothetical protein EON54_06890 [Alcaligenaceae bacterium]
MGKTALAREVVKRSSKWKINSFACIVWTSFKKEVFVGERTTKIESADYSFDELLRSIFYQCASAIANQTGDEESRESEMRKMSMDKRQVVVKNLLKERKVLIVLDNLETFPNSEEVVAKMFEIIGQSKLLITSRHQIADDRVYNITLGGLSRDEGVAFLREEGKDRGIDSVAIANSCALTSIHDVTGGAPLAIKLVVGQLSRQPMVVVLNTLKEASIQGQAYDLYRYIYRYSWEMLDMNCRMVLVDMSVFPPLTGGAASDVQLVSQVPEQGFWSAMDQLVRLSLVDKSGLTGEERFFLHTLTWNFIRSDITKEKEWAE